jgi:hypothetical protein
VEVFPSVDVTEQLPFPPSQEQFIITSPGCDDNGFDSSPWDFSPSTPRLDMESLVFGIVLSIAMVPPGLYPPQYFVVPEMVAPFSSVPEQGLLLYISQETPAVFLMSRIVPKPVAGV